MWLVCLYSYNIVMEDEIIIKKKVSNTLQSLSISKITLFE